MYFCKIYCQIYAKFGNFTFEITILHGNIIALEYLVEPLFCNFYLNKEHSTGFSRFKKTACLFYSMNSSEKPKKSFAVWLKKLGWAGFFFFLIKGLLWLIIPYLIAKGVIGK
jgi:hypothetical protein